MWSVEFMPGADEGVAPALINEEAAHALDPASWPDADDGRLAKIAAVLPRFEDYEDEYVEVRSEGRSIRLSSRLEDTTGEFRMSVSFDPDGLLINFIGPGTIDLVYEPDDELEIGETDRLDFCMALGESTAIKSGTLEPIERAGSTSRYRARVGAGAGRMFARAVRLTGSFSVDWKHDPLWQSRRNKLEQDLPHLSSLVPSLAEARVKFARPPEPSRVSTPSLVIFVHGTCSACLRMVSALDGAGMHWNNRYMFARYEHDTFLPLHENADELADWINQSVNHHILNFNGQIVSTPFEKVILIAHSRGGLVATEAAARLSRNSYYHGRIEILTVGTPHGGTELVSAATSAANIVRGFTCVGGMVGVAGLGHPQLSWLAGLLDYRVVPRGILAMDPNGDFIQAHKESHSFRFPVLTIDGRIDKNSPTASFSGAFVGAAMDQVLPTPNDGVVSSESILSGATWNLCPPLDGCGHAEYFSDQRLIDEINHRLDRGFWQCFGSGGRHTV